MQSSSSKANERCGHRRTQAEGAGCRNRRQQRGSWRSTWGIEHFRSMFDEVVSFTAQRQQADAFNHNDSGFV